METEREVKEMCDYANYLERKSQEMKELVKESNKGKK